MKEKARAVDNAFWRAQTNVPDTYTKGRVRLAAALREIVNEYQQYVENDSYDELFVSSNDLSNLADELEVL